MAMEFLIIISAFWWLYTISILNGPKLVLAKTDSVKACNITTDIEPQFTSADFSTFSTTWHMGISQSCCNFIPEANEGQLRQEAQG